MNVRQRAYAEVYAWLDADPNKRGPEPEAPENMHRMSLKEWEAGAEDAYEAYEEEESQWSVIEDFLIFLIKAGTLFALMALIYWIHEPWTMVVGGIVILYLVKRWLK